MTCIIFRIGHDSNFIVCALVIQTAFSSDQRTRSQSSPLVQDPQLEDAEIDSPNFTQNPDRPIRNWTIGSSV
ncbi:hypothetical protein TNCT_652201 [Trichonephila clavata]|uniref:Uncharacterized protein n=1 Tax=Trichonephila clavata TaxID=2740835 RepID=A0A8X6EZ55_TRICU|nr:hypothetical protein TNCT_652201 [Trichonephila clavata]